ncbi:hypothetical protein B0H15DRAFT_922043 [Mycena belliarum]|uniref:Uncharacterized protein n=1 Tax=Mycena belliarum TaxID=1033014 RepID=A0AAD6UC48_9AGAR|nr:hypothetical protein B0H15DRAFT_922043 [Mycena belliae]
MFTTFTALLATAVVANAASSSSTANPYIPTGISSSCTTYLNSLNADTQLTACTSALMTASSAFGPGGNATSPTKSDITTALTSICKTSTTSTCSQSLIAGKLASFYTACGAELTSSPNAQVKMVYDTFYSLLPLLSAVCSTDDTGNWCVMKAKASSSAKNLAPALKSVARRAEPVTAYMPNATTINTNNILFLFLDGSLPKADLCTTCTRNIITSYVSFEAGTQYAPGIAQSVLMSGQTAIYSGVVATCGADFLAAVKAAGGLGSSGTSGSSGALAVRPAGGLLAVLLAGLVALVL